MKTKIITLLYIFLLSSCSPTEVTSDKLIKRVGITYEINSTTPFTGVSLEYWEDGQLLGKSTFKNGVLDGHFESFYSNGQLQTKTTYKNGEFDGRYEYFHSNGQLRLEITYKNGLRDGYYESFFDNGQLDERAALNNGKIVGLYESFYDTGQIWLRAVYENGEEVRFERFDRDEKRVKDGSWGQSKN